MFAAISPTVDPSLKAFLAEPFDGRTRPGRAFREIEGRLREEIDGEPSAPQVLLVRQAALLTIAADGIAARMAASDALTGADAAAYAGLMQALVTVL
jgi:hypothetical protein